MKLQRQSAFTLVELIVAFGIVGILLSIGMVNIPKFQAQMKASEEIRRLGLTINSLRNEAIRLRTNVRVNFTEGGYSWDISNNSSIDGTYTFKSGTSWVGITPAAVTINGLGLTRGIATTRTFTIRNRSTTLALTLNSNGFITF